MRERIRQILVSVTALLLMSATSASQPSVVWVVGIMCAGCPYSDRHGSRRDASRNVRRQPRKLESTGVHAGHA